ncbi:MAG: tyrosine-type recombinase/integrase [Chloroflexi bacterium]|nr:tyrosine-type recombinase/integrase [Chloroflexota bacterium]
MQLQDALEQFLRHYNKPKTRYNADGVLRPLIEWLGSTRDVERVTAIDIHEWVALMNEQSILFKDHPARPTREGKLSAYTIHGRIKTIRSFFNWLVKMDVIEPNKNPARNIAQKTLPRRIPEHRIATDEEIHLITMAAFGHARNYAIILFMRDIGCRAMEIAGLTLDKLYLSDYSASVLGKGDIWRDSFFGEECALALQEWLRRRPPAPHQYVFCATRGAYNRLTATAISDMVERAAIKAGIDRPIHSHHFRHWRATNLIQQQVDIPTAAAAMGDTIQVFESHYLHTTRQRVQDEIKRTAYKSRIPSYKSSEVEDR